SNQSAISPDTGSAPALRDSIAQVINKLTGSEKTGETLTNERLPEDVLFAALVHDELSQTRPELAEKLLARLLPAYEKNLKKKDRQAIFRSVDDFLSRQVRKGNLTKDAKASLIRDAFGKAQLDENKGRLRRRIVELAPKDASPS